MPLSAEALRIARPFGVGAIVSILVVALTLAFAPNLRWRSGPEETPFGGDFLHEWLGGFIVRTGNADRLYEPAYSIAVQHNPAIVGFEFRTDRYMPIVYPPFYYLLVSPFSAFSFWTGTWVWIGFVLSWFVGFVIVAWRLLRAPPDSGPQDTTVVSQRRLRIAALLALPAAVLFPPFAENLISAQKGTLLLLLLTSTLFLLERGHSLAAGIVFGLLGFKPQLAIAIPAMMLLRGQFRFVAGVATTLAVYTSISLILSLKASADYVVFLTNAAEYIRAQPAYLNRLHGVYAFFTLLAGEPTLLVRIATVVGLTAVGVALLCLFRGSVEPGSARFRLQYSGAIVATLLVTPHLLSYDLMLLLLPFALVASGYLRGREPERAYRVMFYSAICVHLAADFGPAIASIVPVQITAPAMFAFLLALLHTSEQIRERTEPPSVQAQ